MGVGGRSYNEGTMRDKNDTGHYGGVLLEDMNDKLDVILEGQQSLAHVPAKLEEIDTRLSNVEFDVKVIKLAVKHQSKDHNTLVKQVTKRWNKR